VGGTRGSPTNENAPGCGSGGVFRLRRPFPGQRAGESWLCGPATLFLRPLADPAVAPAHPIWRPIGAVWA